MKINAKPSGVPRRANGIRRFAADMASRKLNETNARQAISDRIGYAVATLMGAAAFRYGGQRAVLVVLALYVASGTMAYRRYRRIKHGTSGA